MRLLISSLVATLASAIPVFALALSNSAQVPVLLYHPGVNESAPQPCGYHGYAQKTLEADLEMMYERGITVVPLFWLTEWATGLRDGSTLPDKVLAITTDEPLRFFRRLPGLSHAANGN